MSDPSKNDQEDFISEGFRDTIATVDETGKRIWMYPKKVKGRFFTRRAIFGGTILALFFGLPFLRMPNGQPVFLFDVFERKFILLGNLFVPQDFFILALTLILIIVGVILFTVAFGRLWCGWACPQTLFMELLFRQIEYLVEGDAPKQRALNKSPWNGEKIRKKSIKHLLFVTLALILGNTFLMWLVGNEKITEMILAGPSANWSLFVGVMFISTMIYLVFSQFREQVCIAVCPYGRLQGVLLDKDSVVISYDYVRGEQRGRISQQKRDTTKEWGDCIDCHQCVDVCPTGIDIRNGTQLECINCTACMDACDSIMDKVKKPKGLIRYASENQIKSKKKFKLTPRMMAYAGIVLILIGVVGFLIGTRSIVEATILKTTGQKIYEKTPDGQITNMYTIQVVNKSSNDMELEFKLIKPAGATMEIIGSQGLTDIELAGQGMFDGIFILSMDEEKLNARSTEVEIEIWSDGSMIEVQTSSFIGPFKK